jgi:hypothetical protein
MPNELKDSFEALVAARQRLRTFCSAHYRSVDRFRSGISFNIYPDPAGRSQLTGARHLSSSATCNESLLGIPSQYLPEENEVATLADQFAKAAIEREPKEWRSDQSADIYCRCRALPLVMRRLSDNVPTIIGHIEAILHQLNEDPKRFAIGEASDTEPDINNWYPPNAFHTYWTLLILEIFECRFYESFEEFRTKHSSGRLNVSRLRNEMLLWARQVAGQQAALHSSDSAALDSDQLMWSLSILIRFGTDFESNLADQELIRSAFRNLFRHQTETGTWRTGGPLFHYKRSGNAYCYVFESFSVLLNAALVERKESKFLRQTLSEPGFPRWIVVHGFEGFSGLIFWHRVHSSSGFGWVWRLRLGFFRWIWSGSDRFDAAAGTLRGSRGHLARGEQSLHRFWEPLYSSRCRPRKSQPLNRP